MNPAVLFEGLKSARCIILASGTLSPLISLHSELGTEFKLKVTPNHVILKERVSDYLNINNSKSSNLVLLISRYFKPSR